MTHLHTVIQSDVHAHGRTKRSHKTGKKNGTYAQNTQSKNTQNTHIKTQHKKHTKRTNKKHTKQNTKHTQKYIH